jgi:hypothetical protein
MIEAMHDGSFWQELADRMNAEQARLKARYDAADARKRAILDAWLGDAAAGTRAPERRAWFRRIPLFAPRFRRVH